MYNNYESSMLEHFSNQIIAGKITVTDLENLYESGRLSPGQKSVILELAPAIGGLKNLGSKIASGIGNFGRNVGSSVRSGIQNAKDVYNQGVDQQRIANQQRAVAQRWKRIENTLGKTQVLQQLNSLGQHFPQDKYVTDLVSYINQAVDGLKNHLSKNYPYMNLPVDNQQTQPAVQHQAPPQLSQLPPQAKTRRPRVPRNTRPI